MESKNYSEAFVEVLDILKHTEKEAVDKIPKKLIELFEKNASETYTANLDHSKEIADMNLKTETLSILSMIYRNYWCTPEEKIEYDKLLNENEAKFQKELYEKYNPDNIFKKPETENVEKEVSPETLPVVVKKDSFYQRLVNFLKNLFKKN